MKSQLFLIFLFFLFLFYAKVRFSGITTPELKDWTYPPTAARNRKEKCLREVLIFFGIIAGGIYGLFEKKIEKELDFSDSSFLSRCANSYGVNRFKDWFNDWFVLGCIVCLQDKAFIAEKFILKKEYLINFAWMFGITLSAFACLAFVLWFFGI